MRAVFAAPVIALVACGHAVHPSVPAGPGVTIAVYGGASAYAVIDERRWLALDSDELSLDHVGPNVELASLWIDVLDDPRIAIDRCTRPVLALPAPAIPAAIDEREKQPEPVGAVELSPVVRCRVVGSRSRGRHLVRVVYVTTGISVTTEHAIAMTDPDHARVTSRFAVEMPRWNERGELVVYEAADQSAEQPRELARGEVTLDGSTAVIATPPREVAAHVRRIFSGALPSPGVDVTTASWHAESTHEVWVWLELELEELAAGSVHVHLELANETTRDVDVSHAVAADAKIQRVPLWIDPELSGARARVAGSSGDSQLVEQLDLSVANLGATPREVWIEEQARPGPHRRLTGARPVPPSIHGDVLRSVLEIGPGAIERVRYAVEYDDATADCHVDCWWSAGRRTCERRC